MSESYLSTQITDFYQFIYDCMVEWNKYRQVDDTSVGEFSNIKPKKQFRSFIDYWCYRLYGNFGLKRRIFKYGDDLDESVSDLEKSFYGKSRELLMQFYYDKTIPSYDKGKSISQLCRHLVFDINSMSIVSLGITKSIELDTFNGILNEGDKINVEEFLEGTMIIYNPRLALFNREVCVEENKEEEDINTKSGENGKVRRKRQFQISTRRSMGTSYFNNPGFSFQDMWNDTNELLSNDFGSLDINKWKQYGLVFTLQHPENRIISPHIEKRNVLVGSYKFGNTDLNKSKFDAMFNDINNLGDDSVRDAFHIKFMCLIDGLVEVVDISTMQEMLLEDNINVDIPKCVSSIDFTNGDDFMLKVNELLGECQQFDIGLIIRNMSTGMRSKVRNEEYSKLLSLKGSGPITVSDKNKKELFKVYWNLRQRKDGSIKQFLQIFDNDDRIYTNIFDWYKNCIHDITHKLFVEYLNAFVDKTKEKSDIPFEFKPLCGELHKLYMSTRTPTTKERVIQFVNNLPCYQVYWRIFGLDKKSK